MTFDQRFKPWQVSFLIHGIFISLFVIVTQVSIGYKEWVEIPVVINEPLEAQTLKKNEEKPKVVIKSVNEPKKVAAQGREVFGASRNSYTDDAGEVSAKKGNTLAKEVDNEVLQDSDPDSLPEPTEEYLVSEMPVVLSEVRPKYPEEARNKQLTGVVSLDILIDQTGNVREVAFVDGPEVFRAAAIEAMKGFKFRPARVEGKAVAVKIRYRHRFELEY